MGSEWIIDISSESSIFFGSERLIDIRSQRYPACGRRWTKNKAIWFCFLQRRISFAGRGFVHAQDT